MEDVRRVLSKSKEGPRGLRGWLVDRPLGMFVTILATLHVIGGH